MAKYALVPKSQWKYLNEEMTLGEAKKYLGDVNPDTTKYTAHGGEFKRIQRNVEDADFWGGFEVLGNRETFKLSELYDNRNEIVLYGDFAYDSKKPQSNINSNLGKTGYSATSKFYRGASILYSLKDIGDAIISPLIGKDHESTIPAIKAVGNLSFNERSLSTEMSLGLSTAQRKPEERAEVLNILTGEWERLRDPLSCNVTTRSKNYIWGPKVTDITHSEDGGNITRIERDKYKLFSPLGKITGGSSRFPVPIGVDSGYTVTTGDDNEIELYRQQTDYFSEFFLRTLLGRRMSDVTVYKDTDKEFEFTVKPEFEFWKRLQLPNPVYWAKNLKRMVFGGEMGFQEKRHMVNVVSPLARVEISGINEEGQVVGGYMLVHDETIHSDLEYVFRKYTPDGSLLFNYSTLVDDEKYQEKIARRLRHVDSSLAEEMLGAEFSSNSDGSIDVKQYDENNSKVKVLGKFEIDNMELFRLSLKSESDLNKGIISDKLKKRFKTCNESISNDAIINKMGLGWDIVDGEKTYTIRKDGKKLKIYGGDRCYFRPERSGLSGYMASGDIEIGEVRQEDGYQNVYIGEQEIGSIILQRGLNVDKAITFKKEVVDLTDGGTTGLFSSEYSLGNVLDGGSKSNDSFTMGDLFAGGGNDEDSGFMDGMFGLDSDGGKPEKKEVLTKEVMVPWFNTDDVLRDFDLSMFLEEDVEDGPEMMSMMVTLMGVDARKLKLAHGDPRIKRLDPYNMLTYIENFLDVVTTARNLNSAENWLGKILPLDLTNMKIYYGVKGLFDVEAPEEYKDHIFWDQRVKVAS